ncbi:S-adenosyl-L-methionine-dependent methyltransferase [Podospora fimiseda]|uniref:S-adenosyl-L-methionine-dependent methyltransferase n=1 Tax=Podospora fimiseda TaxID=252190 RepID=A0AAN7GZF0_9PEZI|nr:S-adenosyl-L-methionine-dependent methyltransferase [Podospora fimiseda]
MSSKPPSRIVELAMRIAINTAKLDIYLTSHNLPTPSFDINGPLDSQIPTSEKEIQAAQTAIIDDTQELRRLILGPRDYLMSYTHNELISQQAITRFKIAHSFPINTETTFAEISTSTNLPEPIVRKFIRHAILKDIFIEPGPGIIAHNAVSRLLVEDEVLHDWVGSCTNDFWPSAANTCDALERFPNSQEPNETGFARANNSTSSIYTIFSQSPHRASRFANAMKCFTSGPGFQLSHLINNPLWQTLPPHSTVVDLGASKGHVCFALAEKYSQLNFIAQDLDSVIDTIPNKKFPRVKFISHDFFTTQPIQKAEVYFFRWIFHNWSDEYCVKILRTCLFICRSEAIWPKSSRL